MKNVLDIAASALTERCGLDRTATLVVGVSGGPDSLCLMDVLNRLGYKCVVAHFNHTLRPEADLEARTVSEMAVRLGLPLAQARADVRAEAKNKRMSIEEAARHLRYEFLFEQARMRQAQAVAVAHTADDQVETVLMHLIRGSGLDGLTGMSFRTLLQEFDPSLPLVRPLLGVWKDATIAYCEKQGLSALHDPSNDSVDYFRNRVRHELIPTLETYNPQIRQALLRTADSLSEDQGLIAARIQSDWQQTVVGQTPDYVAFDGFRLARLEHAARRYLLRLAARHLAPQEETGSELLNRAALFASDSSRKREDLAAGIILVREAGLVYASRGEEALPADAWPQLRPDGDPIPVSVPGRISLPAGWQLGSEACEKSVTMLDAENAANPYEVWLDSEALPAHLELRTPGPGDRIMPLGLGGHSQKVSDFFVNAKLPQRARLRWPLLCDGDLIVWIPGFRPADEFRLRAETRQAIHFSLFRTN